MKPVIIPCEKMQSYIKSEWNNSDVTWKTILCGSCVWLNGVHK